jgi:hypothetical protein
MIRETPTKSAELPSDGMSASISRKVRQIKDFVAELGNNDDLNIQSLLIKTLMWVDLQQRKVPNEEEPTILDALFCDPDFQKYHKKKLSDSVKEFEKSDTNLSYGLAIKTLFGLSDKDYTLLRGLPSRLLAKNQEVTRMEIAPGLEYPRIPSLDKVKDLSSSIEGIPLTPFPGLESLGGYREPELLITETLKHIFESKYWGPKFAELENEKVNLGIFIDGSDETSTQSLFMMCFHIYNLVEYSQCGELSVIMFILNLQEKEMKMHRKL